MSTLQSTLPISANEVPQAERSASWLPRITAPRRMLVAALGVGILAELLLDMPTWGISFPLVVVALLGALLAVGGREGWQRARPNAWLAVPLLIFSGFVAVRASPWLVALNVAASGLLLVLLTHFWAAGRVERLGLGTYPITLLSTALQSVRYAPALAREGLHLRGAWRHAPRLLPFARGLLIALPVLGVFSALLGSADLAFSSAMDRVFALHLGELLGRAIAHSVDVLVCAGVAAATLGHSLRRRAAREWGDTEAAPAKPRLGLTEALTLILSVDALFLVFAGFQIAYLFIGGATSPAPGYSYAEYARRGFFELVWVSALTLALIMALARWTRRESPASQLAFRLASGGTVALSLIILASAMKRMALYEEAFGYTQLRLYTHVFMFALGAVLTWRAVTLWWRPERFAIGVFLTALGSLLAINVINPDAFIARNNLLGMSDDLHYLYTLSPDAVPEMVRNSSKLDRAQRAWMITHLTSKVSTPRSWREWTLAEWEARRALEEDRPLAP
jgi:hypothetical protein